MAPPPSGDAVRWRPFARGALVLVLLGVAGAPVGWFVSDHFEARNEFCVACHLDRDRRLHERKALEFEAREPVSLAALHAAESPGFRCIDCHAGASFVNKLRVKTVAARDAARWLIGAFDEPTGMAHPLWNEDCVQCHARYDSQRDDDFHAHEVHNVRDFAYSCVACHRAHPAARPELRFLDRQVVLPVCRNCHEEF
ncbi:MAG: cytochrome c3 family protein [Deltaproteobacteria bacterium]|nr:cytochrome c3 family protein [Deltaproteobacteria bacterium]MBW2414573.1 cytochrome c3 family protein [Deltaproteobacteria bacterium]